MTVWLRFEKKKKDGTVWRLRIQDLPPERVDEATELMLIYFVKDEPFRKAIGFTKNPKALAEYREYVKKSFTDPSSRTVMCCADTLDNNPVIMGVSSIGLVSDNDVNQGTGEESQETKLMDVLCAEDIEAFDVLKQFNITCYFAGKSLLILPEYRGHGISEKFLTVRRLMCAVYGVPLTAAWMSSLGTQITAQRDGWKTVCELDYLDITRRHGITFEDVPPTCKLCVAGPHLESSIISAQVGKVL